MVATRAQKRATDAVATAPEKPAKRAAPRKAASVKTSDAIITPDASPDRSDAAKLVSAEAPSVAALGEVATEKRVSTNDSICTSQGTAVERLRAQIEKAVGALVAHEAAAVAVQRRNVLALDDDAPAAENQAAASVWLNVRVAEIAGDRALKPTRLPIPHPWRSAREGAVAGLRVCLVGKDPQRTIKDAVAPLGLTAIVKVAGIGKLRKKHPSFESRRQLVAAHDMFLADSRVFGMLPGALGKEVYARKKHPVPVDLGDAVLASRDALRSELAAAIEATYVLPVSGGDCISIRVGVLGQSAAHISANVEAVVRQLGGALPGGFANVRSLHMKTPRSVALPIYARAASSV